MERPRTPVPRGPIPWLRRAERAVRRAMDEELVDYGLSFAQLDLLVHLWAEDGLEQRDLVRRLGVSGPAVTGVVDGLVRRGRVVRRESPEDARVKRLYLTDEGRALRQEIGAGRARFTERVMEGFSPEEAAALEHMLRRMVRNAGDGTDA